MTRLFLSGITFLLVSIGLGFAAASGMLVGIDKPLFKALAMTRTHSPDWAIVIAQFVTQLGDPSVRSLLVIGALAAMAFRRHWRDSLVYLVSVAGAITGYSIMKEAFARARPQLVPWLDHAATYAYPSGHAAGSMVVLLLGALLIGGRATVFTAVLLSLAIGLSRITLGLHWPSDVVGGWMFGAGAALIGASISRPVASRPQT